DMNKALIVSKVALAPGAPPGTNIYVHNLSPSTYQLLTPGGFTGFAPAAVGASNDFGRVFFSTGAVLTPDSPPGEFTTKLYEWDGSTLRNVGRLPGKATPFEGNVTTYAPELRPVSEAGTSVVFAAEEGVNQLQVFRRAGGQTVEVSTSHRTVPDPAGPRP